MAKYSASRLEEGRARHYERSWQAAASFVGRLVIRPADALMLPDAARAIGGVRATLDTSLVRIDHVSHALTALCHGVACRQGRPGA